MKRYVVLLTLTACIEAPPRPASAPPDPIVVGIRPDADVATDATVRIGFSEPVLPGVVNVARADGRAVRIHHDMSEVGDELLVSPDPAWPRSETLTVTLGAGFVAPDGRTLDESPQLHFRTGDGEIPPPRPVVRAPPPGSRVARSLKYLFVASSPPLPTPPGAARLEGDDGPVALLPVRMHESDVLFELQSPLLSDRRYRLVVDHPDVAPGAVAKTTVHTSTSVDDVAPTVTSTRVSFDGDRMFVDVDADEAVTVDGVVVDVVGRTIALASHPMAGRQIRMEPVTPVAAGVDLVAHLTIVDLFGNEAPSLRIVARSPAQIRAHISEVVPTPLHDWSDSEGGEIPFDDRPGSGAITSTDEWVEIVNDSDIPVVIPSAGLEIRTIDRSPAITRVHGAPALYFGDGGTPRAWWPGEALVVRTRGDMSQRQLTVELWSGSSLLDRLTLGQHVDADHPGGSPPDVWFESVARSVDGTVRWCVPTPGHPIPADRCL